MLNLKSFVTFIGRVSKSVKSSKIPDPLKNLCYIMATFFQSSLKKEIEISQYYNFYFSTISPNDYTFGDILNNLISLFGKDIWPLFKIDDKTDNFFLEVLLE